MRGSIRGSPAPPPASQEAEAESASSDDDEYAEYHSYEPHKYSPHDAIDGEGKREGRGGRGGGYGFERQRWPAKQRPCTKQLERWHYGIRLVRGCSKVRKCSKVRGCSLYY